MWKEIKEIINKISHKLYPDDMTCFICGKDVENENCLCDKCSRDLPWNDKICLKCGSPSNTMANYCLYCQKHKQKFNLARAPLIYSDKIVRIVQEFKYNSKRYLSRAFARIMAGEYEKMVRDGIKIDLIAYVPLYKKRQKKRGYNQSELLAEELSKIIGVPVSHGNLSRIKNTETQTYLSYKERQENLDNAFIVKDKEEFKSKNILLIDDVLTTGSTANHCTQSLKKSRAKNVYVLTFATTDGEK